MNKLLLIFYFVLQSLVGISQGEIKGKVVYLNSGRKSAEGVYISAKGSNGTYSKSNGVFTLTFPTYSIGTTVYLKVGTKLILNSKESQEIELVNVEKVSSINIPIDPSKSLLKIVVCPKGYRNEAALRYYKLIKSSSKRFSRTKGLAFSNITRGIENSNGLFSQFTAGYNLSDGRLRGSGRSSNKSRSKYSEEIDYTQKENDSVLMYKKALEWASINRDDANKRMLDFLNALDLGLSIEEANKILNADKAFQEALSGEKNIFASIDEMKVNANNLIQMNQFEKAIQEYENINFLLSRDIFNPKLLINSLIDLGSVCQNVGYDYKAIENYNEALRLMENHYDFENKYEVLKELGLIYYNGRRFTKAKKYLLESITLVANHLNKTSEGYHQKMITPFQCLADIYRKTNKPEKELDVIKDLINFSKYLYKEDAQKYNNIICQYNFYLSEIYLSKKEYEKAENAIDETYSYYKKMIEDSLELNGGYSNLIDSICFLTKKFFFVNDIPQLDSLYNKFNEEKYRLLIRNKKKSFNEDDIKLNIQTVIYYTEFAEHFVNINALDSAKGYFEKSVRLLESLLEIDSIYSKSALADVYFKYAGFYNEIDSFVKSEELYLKSLKIHESLGVLHLPDIANINSTLGSLYSVYKKYGKAKKYFSKAEKLYRELNIKSFKNYAGLAYTLRDLANVYYETGELEISKRKLIEASQRFDTLRLEGNPTYREYKAYTDMRILWTCNELKEYKLALTASSFALSYFLDSTNKKLYTYEIAETLMEKAFAFRKLKNYVYAETYYENALFFYKKLPDSLYPNLNNTIADMYSNLGRMNLYNDKTLNAKNAFSEYEKLFPGSDQNFLNWSEYYSVLNQPEKAFENLKKAINLGYNYKDWLIENELYNNIKNLQEFKKIVDSISID